jgi:6-phospho-beta-glucosidase
MRLEASAGSLFEDLQEYVDPFRAATGYHRMALQVMAALNNPEPQAIVANVRNEGAISDFADDDVVEVICNFSSLGAAPIPCGSLPANVRGLALGMKAYERAVIHAARERSAGSAEACLLIHPSISDWDAAKRIVHAMREADLETFEAVR